MQEDQKIINALIENIEKVILGKHEQIKQVLATWISGGHILVEDVPGTGKTVLAKAFAKSVNCNLGRVQFTSDLLPSDIIGTTIVDQETRKFYFRKGPVFSTFLIADEINRATPRTQAALLECMGERQITVENKSTDLSSLFFVMATQNPVEQHGTFPLPEAQLDRFSIKINMGYPGKKREIELIKNQNKKHPLDTIEQVIEEKHIQALKDRVHEIEVHEKIYEYVLRIVEATRNHPDILLGASPRGSLTLVRLSQALSLINGSKYVLPSVVHDLVKPVLAHRIELSNEAKFSGKTAESVLDNMLKTIRTPTL